MEEITLEEWETKGKKLYGEDYANWKFVCPACGHISSVQEFIDLGANANSSYTNCIGRINGKGEDGLKGIDNGYGCNWAAYGLFGTLGKGLIVNINGKDDVKSIEVFQFAEK